MLQQTEMELEVAVKRGGNEKVVDLLLETNADHSIANRWQSGINEHHLWFQSNLDYLEIILECWIDFKIPQKNKKTSYF